MVTQGETPDHTLAEPAPAATAEEAVQPPEHERQLVAWWLEQMKAAEHRWRDVFKQMRRNQQLAKDGADEAWVKGQNFVVPILNRHINQAVAQLYAKNPTAVAKRKRKLLYSVWDETPESYQQAMLSYQTAQMVLANPEVQKMGALTGQPVSAEMILAQQDPQALAILAEVEQVKQHNILLDRMGKTMELLWRYFTDEQAAGFKAQMKAVVRRAKVTKVGYVKLCFQRALQPSPEIGAEIDDATSMVASMEALATRAAEGKIEPDSPRAGELDALARDLTQREELVVREGPVFDFPRSDEILVDPACRQLKTFAGARWIAHYFDMTPERVLEVYKVDIKAGGYTPRSETERGPDERTDESKARGEEGKTLCRVYEIQDRKNGQFLTIAEGYPTFLRPPAEPDVRIERFFTVFPLVFNEIEHAKEIYPPSDVELAVHIQDEYNRSRQGLREHRRANRPYWVTPAGALEKQDKDRLGNHDSHEVIEVKGLKPGQPVDQILQRGPTTPIDPAQYDVSTIFQDMLRTVGSQDAQFGATGGATATESSIAESNRNVMVADNVDDLDELLTDLARATGQLMLFELGPDIVKEICGPAAVWPEQRPTREEIAKELQLEIRAGSSGRPNQAADLAKWERATPLLLQVPGINPRVVVERIGELLEIDIQELYAEGMPSLTALNAMAGRPTTQPMGGDPQSDPAAQGPRGAANAPAGPGPSDNGQPQFAASQGSALTPM